MNYKKIQQRAESARKAREARERKEALAEAEHARLGGVTTYGKFYAAARRIVKKNEGMLLSDLTDQLIAKFSEQDCNRYGGDMMFQFHLDGDFIDGVPYRVYSLKK